jgi:glucokinase
MAIYGAIDIGGSKIACGIVSDGGQVLAQASFPTAPQHGPVVKTRQMAETIARLRVDLDEPLTGIGVGSTGPVDPVKGTIEDVPFLPGWNGFNLCSALAEQTGVPVTMENDADAATLGEYYFGAGQRQTRFMLVTLGTGVGVGMMIDGALYRGANGLHPEIGHMTISVDGPPCECGRQGCWESYIGGHGMAAWMREQPAIPSHWQVKDAFEAGASGHPQGQCVIRRFSAYLGVGLANLIMIFAPDVIALAGGIMASRALFWDEMLRVTAQGCTFVPIETTRILPARLGSDTGLVGAACVCFRDRSSKRI